MSVARRRFRIIKEIAEGGFGKVYLAEQISSDGFSRIVAVKLLHSKWSSHDEVVMRTRDEARLLGLIRHQHIVKVEDLTSIDGKCAIVMEYLEGVDLKCLISFFQERGEPFPRKALFEIMLAATSALDAAYNGRPLQGGDPLRVIHRDIKPSNIFVTIAGGVKVLDFGTARANFAEREAKTQALAFGSQGYMAPERMLGEEDTPAADIFSLGVSLFELLALESFGRIPPRPNKFNKRRAERVAAVPLEGPEDWCQQVRDTLSLMLAYDPGERPSAAQIVEMMEVLSENATDMGVRKFCRTLVSEAKETQPELETGDPLNGQIVDEDASIGFGTDPAQSVGSSAPLPSGLPTPVSSGPRRSPAQRAGASAPPAEESSGGGSGKILAVVGVVIVLLVAIGIVLAGGGGLLAFLATRDVPDPGGPVVEAPEPAPREEPALSGSRIISGDKRGGKTVPTTLEYGDSEGAEITISNRDGFKAEWDGKAPFELEGLGAGRFSTLIVKPGGKKLRGKFFTVDDKKRKCQFSFDATKDSWTGGCR